MRILTVATTYTHGRQAGQRDLGPEPGHPPGEREVQRQRGLRLEPLHDRRLEAAQQEDADRDEEDRRLDVVGLPEARPEEARPPTADARRRARVLPLPDRDEHDDADEPGPREDLDDPLERREVPDDRQPVVGLDELEEGVDERREQDDERQRGEPVRRRDHLEPAHPRVAEELLGQRPGPRGRVAGATGIRLPEAVQRDEAADLAEQQRPPDERDDEAHRERHDLHGAEPPEPLVGHGIDLAGQDVHRVRREDGRHGRAA